MKGVVTFVGAALFVLAIVLNSEPAPAVTLATSTVSTNLPTIALEPEADKSSHETLSSDSNVILPKPQSTVNIQAVPNDTLYGSQSYLDVINVEAAWDFAIGAKDVVVAIIDSGIYIKHEDLQSNIWENPAEIAKDGIDNDKNGYVDDINGWNFIGDNNNIVPTTNQYTVAGVNHGTVVAGIAAAIGNNSKGVAGVSWQASIMGIRVINSKGVGVSADLVRGIRYATDNGADIINLSISVTGQPQADPTVQAAINYAHNNGVAIVVSAGNEAVNLNNTARYLACYKNVIAVAAIDSLKKRASFSNYGSDCIDISAPGTGFISTQYFDGSSDFNTKYGSGWNGTSMSAPVVSGVAALIKGAFPAITVKQLQDLLNLTATALNDNSLGSGVVNAEAVLSVPDGFLNRSKIVVAPRSLGGPDVRLYSHNGNKKKSITAYAATFRGGVDVAVGDIDGDGQIEIITVPLSPGGPHVRIFDEAGKVEKQWFAYDQSFKGGLSVASGDLDGDGVDEIVVAPRSQGGPDVRVFSGNGHKIKSITAYAATFRGGVDVAVGDVDGDGIAEIITTPISNGGPHVRVFSLSGKVKQQWFAYDENIRGGFSVAAGDTSNNGKDEIIIAPRDVGGPDVRIFNSQGRKLKSILAFESAYRGGVDVATGDITGDGAEEIITAPLGNVSANVRIFDRQGTLLQSWLAYNSVFRGGLSINTIKE